MTVTSGVRQRSSSITNALNQVPLNNQNKSNNPDDNGTQVHALSHKPRPRRKGRDGDLPEVYRSKGFWDDLRSGRWMLVPSSAFKLYLIPVGLYCVQHALQENGLISPDIPNIPRMLLWPSNRLPNGLYTKGWADLLFLLQQVVLWSFVRQVVTIHLLRPLAGFLKVKKNKTWRFTEQGYAFVYFGIMGPLGLYVMRDLPIWYYRTEHFWLDYPHRQMTFVLKTYYLLQAAYWCQQLIIMVARVEKARSDFTELVLHHLVSLWLIGWSYGIHLTYIGVSIFVTMDVSDIFLALSKCVNYFNEPASGPIFAFFVGVWIYFRHYLNIVILWSVWSQFDLIPFEERQYFHPLEDKWIAPWMKWQIFVPILLLQLINCFWLALILRILYRAVVTRSVADERSDDEEEEEPTTEEKLKALKGTKAE